MEEIGPQGHRGGLLVAAAGFAGPAGRRQASGRFAWKEFGQRQFRRKVSRIRAGLDRS
jgi:hypothetical protein